MGQQASVTLNSVVYAPGGSDKGTVTWVNRDGGVLNSFSTLRQNYQDGNGAATSGSASAATKVVFRLAVPVVATQDSTCACTGKLLKSSTVQISVWMDPALTAAERADIAARAKDLAASAVFTAAVASLDPAYA